MTREQAERDAIRFPLRRKQQHVWGGGDLTRDLTRPLYRLMKGYGLCDSIAARGRVIAGCRYARFHEVLSLSYGLDVPCLRTAQTIKLQRFIIFDSSKGAGNGGHDLRKR
jgi:hypothetical protein